MGADKNIFDINDTSHGHFCERCKFHYLCSKKACLNKVKGDDFSPYYWETKEEKVDVNGCEFCLSLSDAVCAQIKAVIPSYHFGSRDKRLAKLGFYTGD